VPFDRLTLRLEQEVKRQMRAVTQQQLKLELKIADATRSWAVTALNLRVHLL
jgi:hypothetical protein